VQLRAYHRFCHAHSYLPCPISQQDLARYIVHLIDTLSASSVPLYLNVVRLLHLENNYPNPIQSFYITTLLQGIRRELSTPPSQSLPITPSILHAMSKVLDFTSPMAISFWAASLVAFFSFFRKSTLLPKSLIHSCKTEICLADLTLSHSGFLLKIKHTKTLQYRQSLLCIPIPLIKGSPLCPTKALKTLLSQLSHCPPSAPLFSYPTPQGSYKFFTHSSFTTYLKKALQMAGYSSSLYSGHSFRRGGASFAFSCGIPSDLIKIQGDWSSDAYLRYLSSPLDHRRKLTQTISHHILHLPL